MLGNNPMFWVNEIDKNIIYTIENRIINLTGTILLQAHWNKFQEISKVYIYPTLHHRQDMTQSQFLSEVQLVWIQSFPSHRLVA